MIAFSKQLNLPSSVQKDPVDLKKWVLRKRRQTAVEKTANCVALVDLFAGCGGLTLGAEEAMRRKSLRVDIKLAIDIDPECTEVYARNFKVSPSRLVCGSISDLVPGTLGSPFLDIEKKLRTRLGRVDIVVAGPPCQGHSDLNNHSRRDDPKNLLYLRAIRFVELVSPQVVIIENVPGARHDKSHVVQTAASFLEGIGYRVRYETISAHIFGLPQLRRRLVLIAAKKKDPIPLFDQYRQSLRKCSLKDLIGDLEDESKTQTGIFFAPSKMTKANTKRVSYLFEKEQYDLPNSERPACHRDKEHSYKSMYGRLSWDRMAQTITGGFGSMGQGRYVHPTRKRVITPHEAARIQGFPDYFDFKSVSKRTTLHQMIGNAVPPIMAFQPVFDMLAGGYIEVSQ